MYSKFNTTKEVYLFDIIFTFNTQNRTLLNTEKYKHYFKAFVSLNTHCLVYVVQSYKKNNNNRLIGRLTANFIHVIYILVLVMCVICGTYVLISYIYVYIHNCSLCYFVINPSLSTGQESRTEGQLYCNVSITCWFNLIYR